MDCAVKGFCGKEDTSSTQYSNNSATKNITDDNVEEQEQNTATVFEKENIVETYLESIAIQNKNLALLRNFKSLIRKDHDTLVDYVKILSGGAATADPLYSGSIGPGMLTGAVFGEFNKSPPSHNVLEVIRVMSRNNNKGILAIVSNNLANRLNFGSACQSASQEGVKTLLVNVGEDVSGMSVSKPIGRKGLCGIKFLFKIAGAMAREKKTLEEIYHVIEKLKGNCLGTINIQIRPDVMVIGPGCKGEPQKICFLWDTFDDLGDNARLIFITKQTLSHLFHSSSYFSLKVVQEDEIVIMINNLGNLSDFHFSIIIKEILQQLKNLGIKVIRVYSGRFLNSELVGFSLSVLKIKSDDIVQYLDSPVNVTSWPEKLFDVNSEPIIVSDLSHPTPHRNTPHEKKSVGPKFSKQDRIYLIDSLPHIIESVSNMEGYLNKLDNDHDFGTTMSKLTNAIQKELSDRSLKIQSPYEFLEQLSHLADFTLGGVAGGILHILLSSAAQEFQGAPSTESVHISMWVDATRAARDNLHRFTRAEPRNETAIQDAINPFHKVSKKHSEMHYSRIMSLNQTLGNAESMTKTRSEVESESLNRDIINRSLEEIMQGNGMERVAVRSTQRMDTNKRTVARDTNKSTVERETQKFKLTTVESGQERDTSGRAAAIVGWGPEGDTVVGTTRTPDPGAMCLASVVRTIFTSVQAELTKVQSQSQSDLESVRKTKFKEDDLKDQKMKAVSSKLRIDESKISYKLKSEGTRLKTLVNEEELQYNTQTKLRKGESKVATHLKDENSETITMLNNEKQKTSTRLKKEEQKSITVLEETQMHSLLEDEERLKPSTLLKGEEKPMTLLKGEETLKSTTVLKDELKPTTLLKDQETLKPTATVLKDEQTPTTLLKDETALKSTTVLKDERKPTTVLRDEEALKPTTVLKDERNPTVLFKDEEVLKPTTILKDEQNPTVLFKDEEVLKPTTVLKDERNPTTLLKDELSKVTLLQEEMKHTTLLKDEEALNPTNVLKDERKPSTRIKGSKHSTKLKENDSKTATKLREDGFKKSSSFKATSMHSNVSKTTSQTNITDDSDTSDYIETDDVSNQKDNLEEEVIHVTYVKEGGPKTVTESGKDQLNSILNEEPKEFDTHTHTHVTRTKRSTRTGLGLHDEDNFKLHGILSNISAGLTHQTTIKEKYLERERFLQHLQELKHLFDEIAEEIENEVPDENN